MKRIFLFLLTNLAVVFVLSIALRLLGVERILDEQGTGLDLNALLVFAGVFGFRRSVDLACDLQMDRKASDRRAGH